MIPLSDSGKRVKLADGTSIEGCLTVAERNDSSAMQEEDEQYMAMRVVEHFRNQWCM